MYLTTLSLNVALPISGHLILAGRDGGVSMAEPLLFAKRDGIATLTLNRPDVGNAINTALIEALAQASVQCERDASIRCVVLTGAGRLFCVGGRSEEHTSELQSLMRISYAVFCL